MAMREAGHRAVRVDFSKVATVGDVAARVIEAYSELPTDEARAALLQLLDVPRELFEVDKNLTVIF